MDIRGYVKTLLQTIETEGLHGTSGRVPTGYHRGYEALGDDFPFAVRRSCAVYERFHGRVPNLLAPSSFTEKQLLFKFFAPIPLFATSDKLGARKYLPSKLSQAVKTPRVIWESKRAELPSNDDIPAGRYWFKSNHGAGTNMPVIFPIDPETRTKLEATAETWLTKIHDRRLGLWWYEFFERRIFLEEDLSESGVSADDWKFFVCNGKVILIQNDRDRHTRHIQTIYDRDTQKLDVELYFKGGSAVQMPPQIDQMIAVAEEIGKSFDFIRVDLFLCRNEIYMGEIGLVPNGGAARTREPFPDYLLGFHWHAPWMGPKDKTDLSFYKDTRARKLYDKMPKDTRPTQLFRVQW